MSTYLRQLTDSEGIVNENPEKDVMEIIEAVEALEAVNMESEQLFREIDAGLTVVEGLKPVDEISHTYLEEGKEIPAAVGAAVESAYLSAAAALGIHDLRQLEFSMESENDNKPGIFKRIYAGIISLIKKLSRMVYKAILWVINLFSGKDDELDRLSRQIEPLDDDQFKEIVNAIDADSLKDIPTHNGKITPINDLVGSAINFHLDLGSQVQTLSSKTFDSALEEAIKKTKSVLELFAGDPNHPAKIPQEEWDKINDELAVKFQVFYNEIDRISKKYKDGFIIPGANPKIIKLVKVADNEMRKVGYAVRIETESSDAGLNKSNLTKKELLNALKLNKAYAQKMKNIEKDAAKFDDVIKLLEQSYEGYIKTQADYSRKWVFFKSADASRIVGNNVSIYLKTQSVLLRYATQVITSIGKAKMTYIALANNLLKHVFVTDMSK